jgi:choline dehydrogenase-like flavoprotein
VSGDHYDVLVIGSGPGGATTAARVAETGRRVLLLERGDYLPRERDNWDSRAVFGDGKYLAEETLYDLHDRPFRPELHYYVGGNSKVYGAALFRLPPGDFGEVRHPDGVAPAWPLTYEDLEPYYVRAEHLFWVHGRHGEDPFVGHSSRDYRYPPVRHEPRIQQLSDDLADLGLHPFHLPMGVRLTQDDQGGTTRDSPCIRCDRVDGFPCLTGAKADAESAVLRPALAAHPNLTLLTGTTAERLLTDASGAWSPAWPPRCRTAPGTSSPRASSCSPPGPSCPRPCCSSRRTVNTRTAWRTPRTRSAGTTCGTTTWP